MKNKLVKFALILVLALFIQFLLAYALFGTVFKAILAIIILNLTIAPINRDIAKLKEKVGV